MSLLAIGILEKERDFLLSAIGYNTQNGAPTNHLENKLIKTNEAIEELEEYEQKYNQKEFEFRTQCQNTLSTQRVAADNQADRLSELEKLVLDSCLDKGYEIGEGEWFFEIIIDTFYKWKLLVIKFTDKNKHPKPELFYQNMSETTKEMFDKAIKHFSLKTEPLQEDIKSEVDDTNYSSVYRIAGYESDGKE